MPTNHSPAYKRGSYKGKGEKLPPGNVAAVLPPGSVLQADLNKSRQRKLDAEARLAESKLAREQRKTVSIQDFDEVFSSHMLAIRDRVLSWPSYATSEVAQVLELSSDQSRQLFTVLNRSVRDLLHELAETAPEKITEYMLDRDKRFKEYNQFQQTFKKTEGEKS